MGITREIVRQYEMAEQVKGASKEAEELYKLYKAMTPSMQKAIVDIMKTVNGEEIDDRENDI